MIMWNADSSTAEILAVLNDTKPSYEELAAVIREYEDLLKYKDRRIAALQSKDQKNAIIEACMEVKIEAQRDSINELAPLAHTGDKVANGYKQRGDQKDKEAFQLLAVTHKSRFKTIAELKSLPEFKGYARLYRKGHTLRDWINEAMPGHLQRGRPRQKIDVIP